MSGQSERRPVGVRLAGTGVAIPPRVVTNEDLAKTVDTSDEWIVQRTGIRQRRLAEPGVRTRDLACEALTAALTDAGLQKTDLQLLILATMTPEMACPSTAAQVIDMMGAIPAGAIDINAACSGFVYGLNMASGLIQSGHFRTIGVAGAELLSSVTDWKDRRTCVLFGDGAGAAIVCADPDSKRGCLYQTMHSNGKLWPELYVPRREEDVPAGAEFTGVLNTIQMNGREVYRFAVTTLQSTVVQVLERNGLASSDLAMVIAHQSNSRILESACERLGLPPEKLYINIDRYGNTSAASVPVCLHELRQTGRIKEGDLVLFVALGGGMTWAASLWRL